MLRIELADFFMNANLQHMLHFATKTLFVQSHFRLQHDVKNGKY